MATACATHTDADSQVETSLKEALELAVKDAIGPQTPPRLAAAMRHAVLGGGARLRPRLAIAVAEACGKHANAAVLTVACAIEILHCASLVHDDLPAFDDADLRRGTPTVHRLFGEAIAVLVGDALIAHAIAMGCSDDIPAPLRVAVVRELAQCVGSRNGLVAGQAWESEPGAELSAYHQLKTGALFESVAYLGALVSGSPQPQAWSRAGLLIGEAYQIADDIRDSLSEDADKPTGQDLAHDRPSALREYGIREAMHRLHARIDEARHCVPNAPHPEAFMAWIDAASARLRVVAPEPARKRSLEGAADIGDRVSPGAAARALAFAT